VLFITQRKNARRLVKSLGYDVTDMVDSEIEDIIREKYVLLVEYDCQQRERILLLPKEIESELIDLDKKL